jgi:uncharacterized protein
MSTNVLINFLNSDNADDEAMDFIEMHGYLTSLAIQSGNLSNDDMLGEIFSNDIHNDEITAAIFALKAEITQCLFNGEFPELPENSLSDDESDELILWASGFMQGIFAQEELWFAEHADEVAELTLPILSCSGLLDESDEDEILDITSNDEIMDAMVEKIPDCAVDLYLLFNAPADA